MFFCFIVADWVLSLLPRTFEWQFVVVYVCVCICVCWYAICMQIQAARAPLDSYGGYVSVCVCACADWHYCLSERARAACCHPCLCVACSELRVYVLFIWHIPQCGCCIWMDGEFPHALCTSMLVCLCAWCACVCAQLSLWTSCWTFRICKR